MDNVIGCENSKEIGRVASRILEFRLPSFFIIRNQETQEDYGIDGEIEVASRNDTAEGIVFKVQIKGQKNVKFSSDGAYVHQKLSVARLGYYLRFEIPIFLFVVDVTTQRIFWISLQNNNDISTLYQHSIRGSHREVTVKIPVTNEYFPHRFNDLLDQYKLCLDYKRIVSPSANSTDIRRIIELMQESTLQDVRRVYGESLAIFNYEEMGRLYGSDQAALFDRIFTTQRDIRASLESKFIAALYEEKLYYEVVREKVDINLYLRLKRSVIRNLHKYCRFGGFNREHYMYYLAIHRIYKMELCMAKSNILIANSSSQSHELRNEIITQYSHNLSKLIILYYRCLKSNNGHILMNTVHMLFDLSKEYYEKRSFFRMKDINKFKGFVDDYLELALMVAKKNSHDGYAKSISEYREAMRLWVV